MIRKYMPNEELGELDEIYRRISHTHSRVQELERYVNKFTVYSLWIQPDLLNGCAQPTTVEPFAYKVSNSRIPKFKGHIDVSAATSPVVAFTLPIGIDDNDDYVQLPNDVFKPTIITPDNGTTFMFAMIAINSSTGDVTLTWPVS